METVIKKSKLLALELWMVFLPLFLFAVPVHAQTKDQPEKHTAILSPEQSDYERFRAWVNAIPPEQRNSQDLLQHYRQHLKSLGFPNDQADRQINMLAQGTKRAEVERWNRILTAEKPAFNTKPNAFLVEMASSREPGKALDVGMGQGRNAIWLAQQGWDVTGFDPAEKAVALAQETARKLNLHLKAEVKETENFHFGERQWDLIVLSYVEVREMASVFQRALKPGGIVVIEAFHRDATQGRSIGNGVVFDSGELPKLFPQLQVARYEEPMAIGDFGQVKMRLVRFCGQNPE